MNWELTSLRIREVLMVLCTAALAGCVSGVPVDGARTLETETRPVELQVLLGSADQVEVLYIPHIHRTAAATKKWSMGPDPMDSSGPVLSRTAKTPDAFSEPEDLPLEVSDEEFRAAVEIMATKEAAPPTAEIFDGHFLRGIQLLAHSGRRYHRAQVGIVMR